MKPDASCSCFGLSLGTCQVDNVELGLDSFALPDLLVVDGEDCMTSGRVFIHGMGTNNSNFLAILEHLQYLFIGLAEDWVHSRNKHRRACGLHFDLVLLVRIEQIS